MGKKIYLSNNMRFAVKSINFIYNKEIVSRKFIVIIDEHKNIVYWTSFHVFIDNKMGIKKITHDNNSACFYVVQFLNYIFFNNNLSSIKNITIKLIQNFLNSFSLGLLKGDRSPRQKQTVETCIRIIITFCENIYKKFNKECLFDPKNFYDYKYVIGSNGKPKKTKFLNIKVTNDYEPKEKLKDLPTDVFFIFLNHVINNHIDILMPVALSAFAGLRPSETLNVRREDSLLGPGLTVEKFINKVTNVKIDLSRELNLRSDHKSVGKIKKERVQQMDPLFIDIFMMCYEKYLQYVFSKNYELTYGPLILDKSGKAMLYSNYYNKFKKAMNETQPMLLSSGDEKLITYSHHMSKYSISPQILRHWFSAQIAINYPNISVIMSARGDKDPESAKVYLQNKSELALVYKKINDYHAEFLKIQGEKLFNG